MVRQASEEKFSYVIIQKRPKPLESIQLKKSKVKKQTIKSEIGSINTTSTNSFGRWTDDKANITQNVDPTPLAVLNRFVEVEDDDLPALVDSLLDEVDWEEYNPPLYRREWGRILRFLSSYFFVRFI
jgi:hypothetical protein